MVEIKTIWEDGFKAIANDIYDAVKANKGKVILVTTIIIAILAGLVIFPGISITTAILGFVGLVGIYLMILSGYQP